MPQPWVRVAYRQIWVLCVLSLCILLTIHSIRLIPGLPAVTNIVPGVANTPLPIILENIIITAEPQFKFLPTTASSGLTSWSTDRVPKVGFRSDSATVAPYVKDEDEDEDDGNSC